MNLDNWNAMFKEVSGIRPVLKRVEETADNLKTSVNAHSVAVGQLMVQVSSCEKQLSEVIRDQKDHVKDYAMHGGIREERNKTDWHRLGILVAMGTSIAGLLMHIK